MRAAVVAVALAAAPLMSLAALGAGPESVSVLAAKLSPAVVNIGTSRHVPGGGGLPFPEAPEGSPLGSIKWRKVQVRSL